MTTLSVFLVMASAVPYNPCPNHGILSFYHFIVLSFYQLSHISSIPTAIPTQLHILIFLQRTSIKEPKGSEPSLSFQSHDLDTTSAHSAKSNLWTLQAREDIYNRRQKGEEWETICKVGFIYQSAIIYPVPNSSSEGLSNSNSPCDATAILGKHAPS